MRKKLIISEEQYKALDQVVNESAHTDKVGEIVADLNKNYKKALETYRAGNEYKQRKVFEIIADGELISPKDLLTYLKEKYNSSDDFLKQLLNDWCDGAIKDDSLSKSVTS
tara:strand:+ start:9034 stop:9366 length:333 start_codon:yes stop_codon:yes gene_type:complete